jgi:hypothetical protein
MILIAHLDLSHLVAQTLLTQHLDLDLEAYDYMPPNFGLHPPGGEISSIRKRVYALTSTLRKQHETLREAVNNRLLRFCEAVLCWTARTTKSHYVIVADLGRRYVRLLFLQGD